MDGDIAVVAEHQPPVRVASGSPGTTFSATSSHLLYNVGDTMSIVDLQRPSADPETFTFRELIVSHDITVFERPLVQSASTIELHRCAEHPFAASPTRSLTCLFRGPTQLGSTVLGRGAAVEAAASTRVACGLVRVHTVLQRGCSRWRGGHPHPVVSWRGRLLCYCPRQWPTAPLRPPPGRRSECRWRCL